MTTTKKVIRKTDSMPIDDSNPVKWATPNATSDLLLLDQQEAAGARPDVHGDLGVDSEDFFLQ